MSISISKLDVYTDLEAFTASHSSGTLCSWFRPVEPQEVKSETLELKKSSDAVPIPSSILGRVAVRKAPSSLRLEGITVLSRKALPASQSQSQWLSSKDFDWDISVQNTYWKRLSMFFLLFNQAALESNPENEELVSTDFRLRCELTSDEFRKLRDLMNMFCSRYSHMQIQMIGIHLQIVEDIFELRFSSGSNVTILDPAERNFVDLQLFSLHAAICALLEQEGRSSAAVGLKSCIRQMRKRLTNIGLSRTSDETIRTSRAAFTACIEEFWVELKSRSVDLHWTFSERFRLHIYEVLLWTCQDCEIEMTEDDDENEEESKVPDLFLSDVKRVQLHKHWNSIVELLDKSFILPVPEHLKNTSLIRLLSEIGMKQSWKSSSLLADISRQVDALMRNVDLDKIPASRQPVRNCINSLQASFAQALSESSVPGKEVLEEFGKIHEISLCLEYELSLKEVSMEEYCRIEGLLFYSSILISKYESWSNSDAKELAGTKKWSSLVSNICDEIVSASQSLQHCISGTQFLKNLDVDGIVFDSLVLRFCKDVEAIYVYSDISESTIMPFRFNLLKNMKEVFVEVDRHLKRALEPQALGAEGRSKAILRFSDLGGLFVESWISVRASQCEEFLHKCVDVSFFSQCT